MSMPSGSHTEQQTMPSGSHMEQQKEGTVETSFNVVDKAEVDKEMAHMIYASPLPISVIYNLLFHRFSLRLSNIKIAGYVPPTYNRRMRTSLL